MWKLCNLLFGWDYVHLSMPDRRYQIIRRVKYTGAGRAYVVQYDEHLIWLDDPGDWLMVALTAVGADA